MKLDFNWRDTEPEITGEIDKVFARSTLCRKADNAACGWFTLEEDEEGIADALRSFAQTLEEAADQIEN